MNRVKSLLVSIYTEECDMLKKSNIAHLITCLDEVILGKDGIDIHEFLDELATYTEYIPRLEIPLMITKSIMVRERIKVGENK